MRKMKNHHPLVKTLWLQSLLLRFKPWCQAVKVKLKTTIIIMILKNLSVWRPLCRLIEKKMQNSCWILSKNYNFAHMSNTLGGNSITNDWIHFHHDYLNQGYSKVFSKYCVVSVFSQHDEVWGSFINLFTKYKDVYSYCKAGVQTQGHQTAMRFAQSFIETFPVDIKLDKY